MKPNKVDSHRILIMDDYVRVGGGVVCEHCGFEYYDHPQVVGFEWLKRACNGKLIKT